MVSFDEIKKKAKQQKASQQSREETDSSKLMERIRNRAKTKITTNPNSLLTVQRWSERANKLSQSASKYLSQEGWRKADNSYLEELDYLDSQVGRVGSILRILSADSEDYDSIMQTYKDTVDVTRSLRESIKKTNDYYSQYKTQEQYDRSATDSTARQNRQKKYEENEKRIAELNKELKRVSSTQASNNAYAFGDTSMGFFLPATDPSYSKRVKEIREEIETLETENRKYKRGEDGYVGKDLDEYHLKYMGDDAFLSAAENRDYGNSSVGDLMKFKDLNDANTWVYESDGTIRSADGTIIKEDGKGSYYNPDSVGLNTVNDKLGLFMSATEEEKRMALGTSAGVWHDVYSEGAAKHWDLLNEDELTIYYGLRKTQGEEAADTFLEDMQLTLDQRYTYADIEKNAKRYEEANVLGKILLNAATVPKQLESALFGSLSDGAALLRGEDISPYSAAHGGMHYSQTIRGETAKDIDELTGAKESDWFTWGDLYQSGMSLADSMAAMGIGSAFGSVLLGMGAFENEAYRLYQQGASNEQIALGAAAAGAAELIFERISLGELDKIKNMKSPKTVGQFFKAMLVQGGVEASEEMLTEIANTVCNAFIMGSQSDWEQLMRDSGGDLKAALLQKTLDVLHSGLSGFFSGFGSAGIVGAGSYVRNLSSFAKTGGKIVDADGGVDALKSLAMEVSGANGSLGRQASEIDADSTSLRNRIKVGRLYHNVNESTNDMNRSDIEKALVENGIDKKDAAVISEAMVAKFNGWDLSAEQSKLLSNLNDNAAVKAVEESLTADSSVGNRRQQLRDLDNVEEYSRLVEAAQQPQETAETAGGKVVTEAPKTAQTQQAGPMESAAANDQQMTGKLNGEETPANGETENDYTVSADGKAINTATNKTVTLMGFVSGGVGLAINTDGGSVSRKNISYADEDQAVLYESILNLGISDADYANYLLKAYTDDPGGVSVGDYVNGMRDAFVYGQNNIPINELMDNSGTAKLTQKQRNTAYYVGKQFAGKQTATAEAIARQNRIKARMAEAQEQEAVKEDATQKKEKTDTEKVSAKKGGVYYGCDGKSIDQRTGKLSGTQAVGVDFAKRLAASRGITIYFYESYIKDGKRVYKDANGKIVEADNGFYDPKPGAIHIDLNAGEYGQGTVLFTIAHELTHFIKDTAPAQYKKLCSLLMKGYKAKGQFVSELVAAQQAKAEGRGEVLSFDEAYDEVIADSMESILTDGRVMELMGDIEAADKGLLATVKKFFRNITKLIKQTIDAYKGVKPDSAEGRMVQQMEDIYGQLQEVFAKGVYEGGEVAGGEQTEIPAKAKRMARNNYDFAKSFADQLIDYQNGNFPADDTFLLGGTPDVLKKIGLVALPMTINQKHIGDAINGTYKGSPQEKLDHIFTVQELSKLPEKIADPIAVIYDKRTGKAKASESNIDVLVEMSVASGKQVIVAVQINGNGHINGLRIDTNKVATVHGNTDSISRLNEAINENEKGNVAVFYINNKKTTKVLQSTGNPIPSGLSNLDGFINSIFDPASPVKRRFSSITESQQFKRWFGDWQNHSQNASKIVNLDGTPKIMYHGSPAKFSIFDKTKAKYSGLYGRGFYFTDSESHAETYGQKYAVYLNIKNPLQSGLTMVSKSQVQKFLEAVAENEDYSIENYGSYAIGDVLQQVMGKDYKADAFRVIQDISATAIGDMVEAVELFNQVNGTQYDGIIVPTEVVAFYPEQIKSATDNIGTFDGTNPDIRRSARSQQNATVGDMLKQENEQLKADVEQLREMLKLQRTVTNGTKFTKTSVEVAARLLMRSANAKGDVKELAGLLNDLYEHIAGGKELTWESVKEAAQPAVDWLQDHVQISKQRSEYANDILRDLRTSRVYLDDTQVAEVAHRYGSYNNFRKSAMGSIIFAKDNSISLDSKWQELAELYPDVFDADMNAADMPEALMDIISSLRESDTSALEYEYNRDMIAQDLLRQVYDSYWRVSTLRTFADRQQAKIDQLKEQHARRMAQLREESRAKVDRIKADHRAALQHQWQKHTEAMETQRKKIVEQHKESRVRAIAKVRETAEKRDAREKLQRLVLDTVKWISYPAKTDIKCPDILKKPYADFLSGIDLSSKRLANGGDPTKNDLRLANAMDSLATALDRIMTSQDPTQDVDKVLDTGYLDLPANFVSQLRDMTENIKAMMVEGDYVVNTMSAKEVRKLSQMIRTLNHAVKTMSKLYANFRFANVEALCVDTMEFMDALGEIEKVGGVKDFVQWDNALPYYAFKRFGKGGESVFEGLMDAQDKLAFLAKAIFDFQKKTWTGAEAKAWSEDTRTITLPNGNELTLTTADAMSIYCLSRREQGLQHLLGGGVRVMGVQKGSSKAKDSRSHLTVKDVEAIVSSLTDRQKQVAEGMQEFMSTVCSEWGNEISMKRFLTKEFTEEFYFPIESNDENLPVKDPAAQQSDLFRLLNISATKPLTQGANNEVIVRNVFDVFTGHASDMARLNAFGMGLLDYMKWLNYREKNVNSEGQVAVKGVRKSMELAYGNAAGSYVLNLIKDVNGRASDGGDPNILMKWMRNAKTASVGSSLRVATLQLTSYPRAALVLSPKSLALGLTNLPKIKKAKKYCGIALWKSFGFYDTNISRSIEEQMKGVKNVKQKLIELSLKGAEWGDAITWGCLWNACEYEVAATKKYKVGTEEFYQEVGKKLREVVYRTQVVDSTLTRSQIMRSKRGTAQEAASFMSEPTLSANILMDAGFQFNAEKRRTGDVKAALKKTGPYIGRAVAIYSIGQLTSALLEGLWDAWRDDEDEKFGEKFANAFVENLVLDLLPFNKIPIVSDVFEAVLAVFDVGFYSSDKMSTLWITQAVSAVDAWKDVLGDESSVTVYNALYKSMRAVSSYYGVSFSGVMREGVDLWNNTYGKVDSTLKIRQYELSKAESYYIAVVCNNQSSANRIYDDWIAEQIADGYLRHEAEANVASGFAEQVGKAYMAGEITRAKAVQLLEDNTDKGETEVKKWDFALEHGFSWGERVRKYRLGEISEQDLISAVMDIEGESRKDAEAFIDFLDLEMANENVDITANDASGYFKYAEPAGIDVDVYLDYKDKISGISGKNTKRDIMAVIDSLPITKEQKDALYFANDWSEKTLNEAPWH